MAKTRKTKRTQIKELPVEEQELTPAEASKVKGGAAVDYYLKIEAKREVSAAKPDAIKGVDKASPMLAK
jgi:hypothetical protein